METSVHIAGHELLLLPERAMFWKEKKWLLLADLHLGKAAHFRKHGAAIPSGAGNLSRLAKLIDEWKPEKVIFLGDLFHSKRNKDWDRFCAFTQSQPCDFILIKGNHDLLTEADYERASLEIIPDILEVDGLALCHEPGESLGKRGLYELAGHLHPGIRLEGAGRQTLRLPCFVFGERQGILPAFGNFTGLALVEPEEGKRFFVLAENEVLEL
jgi:DNA ligase-associated metallophosphoesterase